MSALNQGLVLGRPTVRGRRGTLRPPLRELWWGAKIFSPAWSWSCGASVCCLGNRERKPSFRRQGRPRQPRTQIHTDRTQLPTRLCLRQRPAGVGEPVGEPRRLPQARRWLGPQGLCWPSGVARPPLVGCWGWSSAAGPEVCCCPGFFVLVGEFRRSSARVGARICPPPSAMGS